MDGGQLLKMITNDKLFKDAVANTIENLAKELAQAKLLINHNPEWSTPIKLSERIKQGSGGIGVYKIYHKDWIAEDVALYIGQGSVSDRKSTHALVFRNKGKAVPCKHSDTKSPVASKMYEYDTDIENWFFSFCVFDNKPVASEYEKILIKNEEPLFNNLAMSGVN